MKNNINVIIIDDEALARDIIKNYLKDYANIEIKAECSNGFKGLKAINEIKPDMIFLDIQMPKISGFEMLELMDEPPIVIFVTAYDQYALKAFEVNAADYLLKPFSQERFREALNKALLFLNDKTKQKEIINGLVDHHDARKECLERIVVRSGSKISIIPVTNLHWLEAQDDYVMLHTKEGKFLKQKTMKYFEEHLDPTGFVRIHRSYIVRISTIKQIELFAKESYRVILTNGQTLPVSKSGHIQLKKILN